MKECITGISGVSGNVVMDGLPGREPTFVVKGFTSDGRLNAFLMAEIYKKEGEVCCCLCYCTSIL